MNLGDHRRDLSVLQTPPFVLRQNPPSASNSPANGTANSAVAPSSYLNNNPFDSQDQFGLSPPVRPGTAPSAGTQNSSDAYFPNDDRRPSVASVVTNASSTGSKSSIGRSFYSGYKKFFGDNDNNNAGESPGSSESSLPPNATPRSHYGFPRPTTPTNSRPRTPLPSSDVVPFIYQDPDVSGLGRLADIRRLGDAPVRDAPIDDRQRYGSEDASASSSHSHRLHLHRNRNKERDKEKDRAFEKELPPRPSSASKDSISLSGQDYRRGLRLHLDGTASSHSSQTRLIRPGSPTPSIASSLSNNPPKSPGENTQKKASLWDKIWKKDKEQSGDSEKEGSIRSKRSKFSEKPTDPLNVSTSGISPVHTTPKRGSGSGEFVNPRTFEYAPVEQMPARKQITGKAPESYGRVKAAKRGVLYEAPGGKDLGSNRRCRGSKGSEEAGTTFQLDSDFSNIHDIVKEPGPAQASDPPDITWKPPESWDSRDPENVAPEKTAEDEGGEEDAQYCIRVFRADSTFATLSCRLQTSATEVLHLLGRKSFLQDDLKNYQIVMKKNGVQRILGPNERPLKIQKRLLEQAGYTEDDHLDEIGREDHSYMCRFTFMMSRMGNNYSLDQDPGLGKLQKYSHVDLQGRNLLAIPIALYHHAVEIISLNLSRNLSLNIPTDFIQQCFQGNEAEKLPQSISAASRLTYLDISNNRLEELDRASLENHESLVALKMANNRLRSLPDTFNQFRCLRSLSLSSNYLTVFPPFICELFTLVDLDISFNLIKTFPLEIGQLGNLDRLVATNNRLTGSLPQTFSLLSGLKELDLRYNSLVNVDVAADLPKLELLLTGHNAISGFQHSFPKLRALHLNSCPVTRFSFPTAMPTLKFLNLQNAKIAALAETLFERLPNLERLVLDKNHIVSFPPQICKLKKLAHMSCFNNKLASLPKEIGQLTDLRVLDLHENNLKTLPGEIWQMTNLVTLNVSSNLLREFPKPVPNPAAQSPATETASILSLGKDDEIVRPDTSRRPSQASGGLLSVGNSPGGGGRKGSLVSIYGPGGRKASVISKSGSEHGTTGSHVSTRKDSAASSRISNTFAFSLRYLHIADNKLSDEAFEQLSLLSELRVLNLSYNEIYDIPSRALSRLSLLNELYLSGNELTSLPAEDLEYVASLKVLHINSNKFQTLPAELGKVRKLLVLDVGSNALKYNISNWPYDWNWNWNLDLKYLNLSGNKRLEIKPDRSGSGSGHGRSVADFSQLSKLRVLGLMDVTLTIPNVPDQTEDRRVRLSTSVVRSMAYGMADSLGRSEHLSMIDMVIPMFRGNRNECVIGLFDGQALSTGGSKVSKYLHEQLDTFLKDELDKLQPDEEPGRALHRAFLNMNKEMATVAMQTIDEKNLSGVGSHRGSTATGAFLGPDDLVSGGSATVVYMKGNNLYVANVGDATAMLVQSSGEHDILTEKHMPGDPQELERIRDAGGYVSKSGKLNDVLDVSRAFGYYHLMPCVNAAPHIHETEITDQQELLIIASKELWEYISPQAVVDIARSERDDLMRAAHKLRDIAIAYGATNKIMVMILNVGDLKKSKSRMRTQSISVGPRQTYPDEEALFPSVKAQKRRGKNEIPDDFALARLDAEVKAPEGDLALVFTDIKNSTLLWETYQTAMRSSIKLHNSIMRRQLRIVGGYEIKTEGDAFMVCFPTATSALLWCFSVQAILLDAPWPSEIVESIHGSPVQDANGHIIYRGLSVRMGIHWGAPVCEPDPITRRMDYFGPMVNRASRITGVADGGQITVSSDFVAEIKRCVKAYQDSELVGGLSPEDPFGDESLAQTISRELRTLSSQGFEVKELGERKLKGLENPEFIHLMYPQSLVGRVTNLGPPKGEVSKTTVDPADIWALWEISLRLEGLCSSLNTDGVPFLKPRGPEMAARLKLAGENATDQVLIPFFEHIVTRIENSMTTLFLRRILAPPGSGAEEMASPLMDLLSALEARAGVNISGRAIASAAYAGVGSSASSSYSAS
ncbi:phosphatase 2C-domain-containing protein [Tuber brumale]|nr:phosphatase 2C-domain-containing protein [Tuber brumale]